MGIGKQPISNGVALSHKKKCGLLNVFPSPLRRHNQAHVLIKRISIFIRFAKVGKPKPGSSNVGL